MFLTAWGIKFECVSPSQTTFQDKFIFRDPDILSLAKQQLFSGPK